MLEHVFEFQFASHSTVHFFIFLGGNFGVRYLLACLHPKSLFPVFACKHVSVL